MAPKKWLKGFEIESTCLSQETVGRIIGSLELDVTSQPKKSWIYSSKNYKKTEESAKESTESSTQKILSIEESYIPPSCKVSLKDGDELKESEDVIPVFGNYIVDIQALVSALGEMTSCKGNKSGEDRSLSDG